MKRSASLLVLLLPTVAAPARLLTSPGPEAAIVRGASASAVLQAWCAARGLPPLAARRLASEAPPDPFVRAALGARSGQIIRHRRVRLGCGGRTLSEADNWYLPGRLSKAMNRALDSTDVPFGRVVRPLKFTRRTLRAHRSAHGFEIRALLVSSAGAPFSYVVEDYAPELDPTPGR